MACESSEEPELSAEVKALALQVAELQQGLEACMELSQDAQGSDLFEVVSLQQVQIQENAEAIATADSERETIVEDIDDLGRIVATTQQQVAQNWRDLQTLNTKVGHAETDIDGLQASAIMERKLGRSVHHPRMITLT